MPKRRRPPWLVVGFLILGLAVTYGGFSIYRDQRSGVPGKAKVTGCEGGSKYDRGIHCTGTWSVGGDAIFGEGELALGRVEGAGYGDVGKTIDVRVHGTDHATKPALATPIVLWGLGAPICLLSLWGLWHWVRGPRAPAALAVPQPILDHLSDLVRQVWSGKDPQPVIESLPRSMPAGTVQHLVGGGSFGWLIDARLDEIDGRLALEALEEDRMSGPSHYRVWEDGTHEALPNERTGYSTPADCPPAEAERIEAEYYEHNRRVQAQLRERGFRRGA